MRHIAFDHPPNLPKRWSKLFVGRTAGLAAQATATSRSTYIKAHGSWVKLKGWLSAVSHGKCWYCEATSSRAPLDVDHFRPKLAVTVDGAALSAESGYFWLAYDWSNFRLSCQRCNRPEHDADDVLRGKANEFPLEDESVRCSTPDGNLLAERPRLLDPCDERDCDLLAHALDGEVKPRALAGSWEFVRADYTIKLLAFNSYNAPEIRRKTWRVLDALIRLAGDNPEVTGQIVQHLSGSQEYSAFFRSAIGSHRDKPWVDALL